MALMMASLSSIAQESVYTRKHIENVTTYEPAFTSDKRRIGSRATAPLSCLGSPKVPVVLVQFVDAYFTVAESSSKVKETYYDFFNAGEGVTPATSLRSVKEYFRLQSEGLFTPEFDIIGPITLPKSYKYYGEDQGAHKDIHIREFFSEACEMAVQRNVDWNAYDNDGDGVVDFVFFIYAGNGQNAKDVDDNAIWPKESSSSYTVSYDNISITFGAYGCTNELYNNEIDGIGTCIHELGHGLGLPDFYDTNYNAYGLDYWDIMDSGCYQISGKSPCNMSAYELDFMGWRKLVTLDPDSAYSLTLSPLEKGGTAYKIVNKNHPNEFFILENRQNHGFDTYFGCPTASIYRTFGANHGLMVTHVDYDPISWGQNRVNTDIRHQRITIVPADGELISSIEKIDNAWAISQHGDLYPSKNNVRELSSYAVFHGDTLEQTINNIIEHEDGTITLDINGGQPDEDSDDEEQAEPDEPEIA